MHFNAIVAIPGVFNALLDVRLVQRREELLKTFSGDKGCVSTQKRQCSQSYHCLSIN